VLGFITDQVDRGHQLDPLRSDVLQVQVGDALDVGVAQQQLQGGVADLRLDRLPDQEAPT
jgi:hypothetical protein